MKKIKDIWQNNKILLVLVTILIICFIIILVVVSTYFFGGSSSSYGSRLTDIEKYKITNKIKDEYIDKTNKDEHVENVKFNYKGKIIYIKIESIPDIDLDEAKSIVVASLTNLDKKIAKHYDINFTLVIKPSENSEGITIMGSKRNDNTSIIWNNNTPIEEEEE